jgi:hypothetical protein
MEDAIGGGPTDVGLAAAPAPMLATGDIASGAAPGGVEAATALDAALVEASGHGVAAEAQLDFAESAAPVAAPPAAEGQPVATEAAPEGVAPLSPTAEIKEAVALAPAADNTIGDGPAAQEVEAEAAMAESQPAVLSVAAELPEQGATDPSSPDWIRLTQVALAAAALLLTALWLVSRRPRAR